jgi:hypothetical protein
MHITAEQNRLLAKLANFILENEIWKHSLLNECEYNIKLFTMKTHIPYRRTIFYLNNAFKKLLGQQYIYEQSRLFGLIVISEPAKFRHKPKAKRIVREQTKPKRTRSDPRKPKSEFGRKYKEHFGQYASTTGKEYHNEYLYFRKHRTRFVGRRKAVSGKSTALLSLRYNNMR